MDKMQAKFNQMLGKENHKTTKDVEVIEKQANKAFINENIQRFKKNKEKTFLDLVMDDQGVVEEYIFDFPQQVELRMNEKGEEEEGLLYYEENEENAVDLEQFVGSQKQRKVNIQIHDAKVER